jgi:cytochrome oxidase assembly protein ShyY1
MIRRLPVISTLVVLVAVAIMIRLGFWQLDRREQKQALIARAEAALAMNADARWPRDANEVDSVLYRHARIDCVRVLEQSAQAGQNAQGESGWAHVARCALAGGGSARVILGWSREPGNVSWAGGVVDGMIAPGPRLVAGPAVAGLQDNAVPNPADLPNNHLSYAVQWFLFAAVALGIYALALRKRLAAPLPPR